MSMKSHVIWLAAAVVAAACDSSTAPPGTVPPTLPPVVPAVVNITAVTALNVVGTVGTEVTPTAAVLVTDGEGRPVRAEIRFMTEGGGVIRNHLIQADINGIASTGQWILG